MPLVVLLGVLRVQLLSNSAIVEKLQRGSDVQAKLVAYFIFVLCFWLFGLDVVIYLALYHCLDRHSD